MSSNFQRSCYNAAHPWVFDYEAESIKKEMSRTATSYFCCHPRTPTYDSYRPQPPQPPTFILQEPKVI